MGNGKRPEFSFSRPGAGPASPTYGNIGNNEQAVNRGYEGQELLEIPEDWLTHSVTPVYGGDKGGPG